MGAAVPVGATVHDGGGVTEAEPDLMAKADADAVRDALAADAGSANDDDVGDAVAAASHVGDAVAVEGMIGVMAMVRMRLLIVSATYSALCVEGSTATSIGK